MKPFKKRLGENRRYYKILDDIFGIYPNNIELYKLALVHRSASVHVHKHSNKVYNNERLEFLGDAVLEAVVSDYLFKVYQSQDEGFLTQMRSKIVSRQSLNELCVKIGLSEHIISQAGGGFVQKHLYGDALEAMIGAIYLDKGYGFVKKIIIKNILSQYMDVSSMATIETDFKSRLIEWCQKSKHIIHFNTTLSEGSTAQNPTFYSVVIIDGMEMGVGSGTSKKEAEQMASHDASNLLSDEQGDSFLNKIDRHNNSNNGGER